MPLERARKNNKPGFRWGVLGFIYTYTPGDKVGRERARQAALRQGRAIEASKKR